MTISHVATGALAHGTTTCSPAYPAGIAAGNQLFLVGACNPDTATMPTLSGWTKQVDVAVGGRRLAVYTKTATGSETGTFAFAPTSSANVSAGISCWSSTDPMTLTYASGADASSDTTFSATANQVLGEKSGDVMFLAMTNGASASFTAVTGSATGATYGASTRRTESGTTNLRTYLGDCAVTAGTATAASLVTANLSVAGTGGAVFVRMSDAVTPNAPPTISANASTYNAGDTVVLTVNDADGTIASVTVTVTGVTPAPTVAGTGSTRTFTAPPLGADTTLTVTATDDLGATASTTITVKAARTRVRWGGVWKPCYRRVWITPPEIPIAGLLLRFKADTITGAEGAAVATWPSSTTAPAATQATAANQPKLRLNAINGHQAVDFDGDDFLALSGTALDAARNKANLTMFVVYKTPATAVSGTRTLFSLSTGTTTGGRATLYQSTGVQHRAAGRRLDADAFDSATGGSVVTGETGVLTACFRWSTASLVLFKNGAQIAADTAFQTAGNTSDTPSLTAYIGANAFSLAESFIGQIAEVLVYDSDGPDDVRAAVHRYVQDTYGINVADYFYGTDQEPE